MSMRLYSYPTGFCAPCGEPVTARIIFQDDALWYETLYPIHGNTRALIFSDPGRYKTCREYVKPRQMILRGMNLLTEGDGLPCALLL
jgi:uncharacterized radical SAM superfamily Fe-S cluster-containing enzyme